MTGPDRLSVLQIISSPWLTGAASATLGLSRVLRGRGHRVVLAAISDDQLEERVREAGLTFEGLRLNRRLGLLDFLSDRSRLREIVHREAVDILHAHLSHDHWVAVAARTGDPPVVVRTFHRARHVRRDPLHRKFCYERTDGFFAVSEDIRTQCEKEARTPKERTFALRGMVDTDFFKPGTGNAGGRNRLGLDGTGPVVGTVSRLAPDRGHLPLLEAFRRIRDEIPEARLLVTGKGEYREAIVRRAERLGLHPGREVILSGYWDGDLRDVLCQLDVFVLQSGGSEGTARALLEAMAYGLPSVVAQADGLDEIVEHGTSGVVVPPSDPNAMAGAIIGLLREPERAEALGRGARERAASEFDERVQGDRVETMYRSLLSSVREKGA